MLFSDFVTIFVNVLIRSMRLIYFVVLIVYHVKTTDTTNTDHI